MRAHLRLVDAEQLRQALIGEAHAFETQHAIAIELRQANAGERPLLGDDLLDLGDKPRIDTRVLVNLVEIHPQPKTVGEIAHPLGTGVAKLRHHLGAQRRVAFFSRAAGNDLVETAQIVLEAAQRLLQRFLEGPPDGHGFADRFHLRAETRLGLGKLLEGEARHLGHDVVDGRLERRGRGAAGNLVLQLIEGVADGELRRHARNRETGRFRGECRRARHPRIHLDDDQPAVAGIDGELHVGAAGVDADLAQHRDRGVAHELVFLVGERLRRRDRDRVAGVNAHGIEVLDGADDDAVVLAVADHLHLELLPAEHRLLEQHLVGRRRVETALADLEKLLAVVGDAAAGAAERERRTQDRRKADFRLRLPGAVEIVHEHRARHRKADAAHGIAELLTVLGFVDGFTRGPDHLDREGREHALAIQIERAVERRLAAHCRQQRLGTLFFDDLRDGVPVDRLDVGGVGHLRVGHDGGGVGVDQHDPVALLAQRLAGLGAGVVELAGLADDDRTGADNEHAFDVCASRHASAHALAEPVACAPRRAPPMRATNSSKSAAMS